MRIPHFHRSAMALAVAASAALSFATQAQHAPWPKRVRAVDLQGANRDSTRLDLPIDNAVAASLVGVGIGRRF